MLDYFLVCNRVLFSGLLLSLLLMLMLMDYLSSGGESLVLYLL